MGICRIDPTTDPRWDSFVENHPSASIFHTRGWLEALRRTYGYKPVAYVSTGAAQELVSGIPFCRIRSFLTGRRLVSLPFSDHCQPLARSDEDLRELIEAAEIDAERTRCRYLEIRPIVANEPHILETSHLARGTNVLVHKLDLAGSEADLLKSFHKDCVRRQIARTEREQLRYEEGRSEELLRKFYRLLLLTRRRHQIPPQPIAWFRNLIDCLGERITIRMASKDGTPVASIVTLSFRNVMTDKYSCSNPSFNSVNGTVFLLWRIIQAARSEGFSELDFGRSDYSTPGLIAFKDHWGTTRYPVTYYRCPAPNQDKSADSVLTSAAKRLLIKVPDAMFSALGGLLYRHVG